MTDNNSNKDKAGKAVHTKHGFFMTIESRKYEVRGIIHLEDTFKATVKGIKPDDGKN